MAKRQPMSAWDNVRGRVDLAFNLLWIGFVVAAWQAGDVPCLALLAVGLPVVSLLTYTLAVLRDGAPPNASLGWHLRRLTLIVALLVGVAVGVMALHEAWIRAS